MTKAKLLPFVNRYNGDVRIMTRQEGKGLNEDWARAKIATNSEGKKVFRFELTSTVKGRDGKMHTGTAVVDISEVEQPVEGETVDGN